MTATQQTGISGTSEALARLWARGKDLATPGETRVVSRAQLQTAARSLLLTSTYFLERVDADDWAVEAVNGGHQFLVTARGPGQAMDTPGQA